VADELRIPIIADEIYHGLLYDTEGREEGDEFYSFANLTKDVPIIVRNISYLI
jgi:aspartate/methionine/tyrosine aminotransferase